MVCDVMLQIKILLSNTPAPLKVKYVSEERETGLTSQVDWCNGQMMVELNVFNSFDLRAITYMQRSHGHKIVAARFPHLADQDLPFYLLNIVILKKYPHHEKLENIMIYV